MPTATTAPQPPPRLPPRRPDHASTSIGGNSTVMIAAYGSVGEEASVAAAVAAVTISASSKRISLVHNTNATTIATVIEVMAHGLNISQAGVPVSAAARPPIQNHPGGEDGRKPAYVM